MDTVITRHPLANAKARPALATIRKQSCGRTTGAPTGSGWAWAQARRLEPFGLQRACDARGLSRAPVSNLEREPWVDDETRLAWRSGLRGPLTRCPASNNESPGELASGLISRVSHLHDGF